MSAPIINTPLNLSYLYEISDDDREFVKDMIETIVKNTPECLEEIKHAQSENNWTEIGRLVHKLKPSLLLLNIEEMSTHIKSLEDNAKKEINLDYIDTQIAEMGGYCQIIVSELGAELENDTF
jgi:HPt (histidine-containing phosphotransfer) domain-containing protein